jgi:hypothetical protein
MVFGPGGVMSFTILSASKILAAGLLVWFALLVVLIAVRILRGDIDVMGLLSHKGSQDSIAPERVLHIAAFPIVVIYYIHAALGVDVSAVVEGTRPSLPDIPSNLLLLLTGTNSFYLIGKALN